MDIYDRIELRTKELGISKAHATNKAREYVFAGRTGKPVENSGLRRLTTVTASRPGFKCGMHALRHTFATNAIRAGVDMRTLADLLGHSDVAFTMQVYGHTDDTMKAAAMERIHNVGKASKDKNAASDGENE